MTSLQRAKRNGCKIVSDQPAAGTRLIRFKHPQVSGTIGNGTKLSDLFLPVRVMISRFERHHEEDAEAEERRPGP